jgi:type IV pilus assembly protein PilB
MSPFKRRLIKERLGQVLLQRGVITAAQLKEALAVQKAEGGLLGETLTRLNFATEEDITQALAMQHDFPYLPLANYEMDPDVIKLIPEDLAKKYFVLPVDKMGDILTVVMANPLDKEAVEAVENCTKCTIEVFVATYTELKETIERAYSRKQAGESGESKNG